MLVRIIDAVLLTLLAGAAAPATAPPAPEGVGGVMNLIDASQKHAVEKSVAELTAASAAQAMTSNKAVATLVGNQHSTVSVRGFSVVQDEPASVAGGATGPTPTDFFVASLGTCQNVVFVRYAALEQIEVEALETTVTGTWDRRGLYGIAGVDPGYREIVVETRVSSPAPAARLAEVARRTRAGCPIFATLRKETAVTVRLILNGQPVPL